jgi:hypothetical protein
MSSDDGLIVEKQADDKFRVFKYCASTEHRAIVTICDSLEAAMQATAAYTTEYGVTYIDCTVSIPEPLAQPDLLQLRELCSKYLRCLVNGERFKDAPQYIFEAAITGLYGKKVWDWIGPKC